MALSCGALAGSPLHLVHVAGTLKNALFPNRIFRDPVLKDTINLFTDIGIPAVSLGTWHIHGELHTPSAKILEGEWGSASIQGTFVTTERYPNEARGI